MSADIVPFERRRSAASDDNEIILSRMVGVSVTVTDEPAEDDADPNAPAPSQVTT